MKMKFKSAVDVFDPEWCETNSNEQALTCLDPSLAAQEMTEDTDINRIVETWVRTGMAPVTNVEALTGDFSNVDDYRTMLDKMRRVNAEFMSFDADVRSYFKNDPANLIAALDDDSQTAKLVEFGIKKAPEVPQSGPAVDAGNPQ